MTLAAVTEGHMGAGQASLSTHSSPSSSLSSKPNSSIVSGLLGRVSVPFDAHRIDDPQQGVSFERPPQSTKGIVTIELDQLLPANLSKMSVVVSALIPLANELPAISVEKKAFLAHYQEAFGITNPTGSVLTKKEKWANVAIDFSKVLTEEQKRRIASVLAHQKSHL